MGATEYQTIEASFVRIATADALQQDRLLGELHEDDPAAARRVRAMLAAESSAPLWLDDGSEEGAEPGPAPPDDIGDPPEIDGFRIVRLIGRGGMGVVYEAEQDHPRRRVAIKLVREGRDAQPETLARFEREADVLGHLQHPGIATVYVAGRTRDGEPYLAMEFIDGRPLDEAAQRLGLAQRLAMFTRLCEVIAAAHEHGVIHLDLKPGNVLAGADGGLKVVDFGLARLRNSAADTASLTSGQIRGTLAYMSPQRLAGTPPEASDDVYSLGAILRHLMQGQVAAAPERPRTATPSHRLPTRDARALQRAAQLATSADPALRPTASVLQTMVDRATATPPRWRRPLPLAAFAAATVIGTGGWLAISQVPGAPDALDTEVAALPPQTPDAAAGACHALGPTLFLEPEDFERELATKLRRADELEAAGRWLQAHSEIVSACRILEALGRFQEAELLAAQPRPTTHPSPAAQALMDVVAARIQARLGRLSEAYATLDASESRLRQSPQDTAIKHFLRELAAARALTHALGGQLDEAQRLINQILPDDDESSPPWVSYHVHRTAAEIARRRGDDQLAAQHEELALLDADAVPVARQRRPLRR